MNVLLLTAHGLHCHWLGPYGNEWVSTPALDALACESVVFDQHFAAAPSASGFHAAFPPALFDSLRAAGVTVVRVDDRKTTDTGPGPWEGSIRTDPTAFPSPGEALVAAIRDALDAVSAREPWLVWVETDRFIPPWDLELETYQQYAEQSGLFDEEFAQDGDGPDDPIDEPRSGPFDPDDTALWHRLHNSFAAAVTAFDTDLAALSRLWQDRGLDNRAAWILTAGFGWPLGEHGAIGPEHARLHPELVHLPLIVRLPAGQQRMRRVRAFSQPSDLAATLLDLHGIAPLPDLPGKSLLPLAEGRSYGGRDALRCEFGPERALRTPDWTFLPAGPDTGRPARLYHKPDDLWEVNDMAARYPDECDRLAALLDGRPEPAQEPPP